MKENPKPKIAGGRENILGKYNLSACLELVISFEHPCHSAMGLSSEASCTCCAGMLGGKHLAQRD